MTIRFGSAALAATMACAGLGASAQRAEAAPLLFKITGQDLTASFQLDSDPIPASSTFLFDFEVDSVSAVINGILSTLPALFFYTEFAGGGFFAFDTDFQIVLDLTGPQVFGGTIYDPFFSGGSFVLQQGLGPETATLTISAVPLPASAPLFGAALLGLGALGYGMKRRSLPQTA